MTATFKVSVVIPCFNHGKFLSEAVASVVSTGRLDVELIVVDDGSTDELTRIEMGKLSSQGIKVFRQENKGLAAARNAAIMMSSGEYILPLDADNRIRSTYIEHGIRILDSDSRIGIVYGDAEYIGAETGHWEIGRFDQDKLMTRNYIDACAIYRRSVWEQNQGYDGTMPVQGMEDWDFWLGALENGWRFSYIPEIVFDYRTAAISMITLTKGYEKQIADFVAKKHWRLYRQAWLQLSLEKNSVKATSQNLLRVFCCWVGFQFRQIRGNIRMLLWHPILNITRPMRHAVGLRQENVGSSAKKNNIP